MTPDNQVKILNVKKGGGGGGGGGFVNRQESK